MVEAKCPFRVYLVGTHRLAPGSIWQVGRPRGCLWVSKGSSEWCCSHRASLFGEISDNAKSQSCVSSSSRCTGRTSIPALIKSPSDKQRKWLASGISAALEEPGVCLGCKATSCMRQRLLWVLRNACPVFGAERLEREAELRKCQGS